MMLLGTAAVGLTAAAMSTASAGEVEKSAAVSGHVNRVIAFGDDGKDGFLVQADPTSISGSRMRAVASAKSESLSIGATIELGTQAAGNSSQHATASSSINLRHSFVSLSNNMGTIRMGHTGHATNGHTGVNLSSTGNSEAMSGYAFDGVLVHTSGSTGSAAGSAISAINGSDMTSGRTTGISYDTPNMNGFGATISHEAQASGSISASYSADYDGVAVKASAGYGLEPGSANDSIVGGGLGVKLANGLSLSGNWARTNLNNTDTAANVGRSDPETMYFTLGYDLAAFDIGKTGLAISYRQTDDLAANNDDFTGYSFLVEQSLADYGTSIYGGISQVSYDTTAANFDDVTAGWVGVKVVF
jgi:hypothetical protein